MTRAGAVGVSTRPAVRGDLPALAGLYREQIEYQQRMAGTFRICPEYDWEAFTARKVGAGNRAVLVAAMGAEIIGFVEVYWRRPAAGSARSGWRARLAQWLQGSPPGGPPIRMPRLGFVEEIFIREAQRGSGCGSQLLEAGLQRLAQEGVDEVLASIWQTNRESLRFFERHGFGPSRVVMRRDVGSPDQLSRSEKAV